MLGPPPQAHLRFAGIVKGHTPWVGNAIYVAVRSYFFTSLTD